jgi:6,7-dimethyl-8-ribityllumazine synthase
LKHFHAAEKNIVVVHCPGAFEIPLLAQELALSKKFDAILCLGCIIRGETPHFDYIARSVSSAISRIGLAARMPVTFGVLTTDNAKQAIARAGAKNNNKGWEAAAAAIELADIFKHLPSKISRR